MVTILGIFAFICLAFGTVGSICSDKSFPLGFFNCLMLVGFILIIMLIMYKEPTALDVYRGKTTLEITYRNGVSKDSIVVFKNSNND